MVYDWCVEEKPDVHSQWLQRFDQTLPKPGNFATGENIKELESSLETIIRKFSSLFVMSCQSAGSPVNESALRKLSDSFVKLYWITDTSKQAEKKANFDRHTVRLAPRKIDLSEYYKSLSSFIETEIGFMALQISKARAKAFFEIYDIYKRSGFIRLIDKLPDGPVKFVLKAIEDGATIMQVTGVLFCREIPDSYAEQLRSDLVSSLNLIKSELLAKANELTR